MPFAELLYSKKLEPTIDNNIYLFKALHKFLFWVKKYSYKIRNYFFYIRAKEVFEQLEN